MKVADLIAALMQHDDELPVQIVNADTGDGYEPQVDVDDGVVMLVFDEAVRA